MEHLDDDTTRILVVDDDRELLANIKTFLASCDYQVETAVTWSFCAERSTMFSWRISSCRISVASALLRLHYERNLV